MKKIILLFFLIVSCNTYAIEKLYAFDDPVDEARFLELNKQLRCLVCQNQNLNDSHAALAKDLRDEVYQLVRQGQSNQAIVDYLVKRYGDFVIFEPPVKANTYVLWFLPFVVLVLGLVSVFLSLRRQRSA